MDGMGRKSKTKQLTDGILGQHLALSVAAHLARTQLLPDTLSVYDGQHMIEMVEVVASALAKVAPLYVQDAKTGTARELTPPELDGASVRRGATILVLRDGRTLSSISIKRADLRQAIAILKATGVAGLDVPVPSVVTEPKTEPRPLHEQVSELESLLREPLVEPQVRKANMLAVALARNARQGHIANLAMQLVSAVHEARNDPKTQRVDAALAGLRAAVEELPVEGAAKPTAR